MRDSIDSILGQLHEAAAVDAWQIDPDQDKEWRESIIVLKNALSESTMDFISGILAEYDFRRRGIRRRSSCGSEVVPELPESVQPVDDDQFPVAGDITGDGEDLQYSWPGDSDIVLWRGV